MITARELRELLDDLAWDIHSIDIKEDNLDRLDKTDAMTAGLHKDYSELLPSYARLHQLLSDLEHEELHASLNAKERT